MLHAVLLELLKFMFLLIFSEISYDDFKKDVNANSSGSQKDILDFPNDTLESIHEHDESKKSSN